MQALQVILVMVLDELLRGGCFLTRHRGGNRGIGLQFESATRLGVQTTDADGSIGTSFHFEVEEENEIGDCGERGEEE